MAFVKRTFTLDERTSRRLRQTANRLGKSQSQTVCEAISRYCKPSLDRLGEDEKLASLRVFDEHVPRIPRRPLEQVEEELRQIRLARRAGRQPTKANR